MPKFLELLFKRPSPLLNLRIVVHHLAPIQEFHQRLCLRGSSSASKFSVTPNPDIHYFGIVCDFVVDYFTESVHNNSAWFSKKNFLCHHSLVTFTLAAQDRCVEKHETRFVVKINCDRVYVRQCCNLIITAPVF